MKPYLIGVFIGAVVSYEFGWIYAHETVSTECQRLGAFYVGDKTFECKVKQ